MSHIDIAIEIALNPENSLGRSKKLSELRPHLKINEHPEKGLLRILAEEIINLRNPYNIQPIKTDEDSSINDIDINIRKRGRPRKLNS